MQAKPEDRNDSYPLFSLHFRDQISRISSDTMACVRHLDEAVHSLSVIIDEEMSSTASKGRCGWKKRRVTRETLEAYNLRQGCDNIAVRKVDLAMQLYDFLDLNVKLIDNEMSILEQGISSLESHQSKDDIAFNSARPDYSSLAAIKPAQLDQTSAPLKRKRGRPRLHPLPEMDPPSAPQGESSDAVAMTVGDQEPVYCVCKRIAFGEMIACDDEDCTVEWFHYPCVNLTRPPRNVWICPLCTARRKKQ